MLYNVYIYIYIYIYINVYIYHFKTFAVNVKVYR